MRNVAKMLLGKSEKAKLVLALHTRLGTVITQAVPSNPPFNPSRRKPLAMAQHCCEGAIRPVHISVRGAGLM